MPVFSFTEAAFEGFRFTRERPGAVAAWAAATFAFNIASSLMAALVGGDAYRAFLALGSRPTLGDMVELFPPAAPAMLMILIVNATGVAFIYASAIRSFIGIDPTVRFRIGADERRLFLIILIGALMYFLSNLVIGGSFGLLEYFIGDSPVTGFLILVSVLALFLVPAFVIVRLSLVPIIAVDRKRIDIMESWVSTRGHFWPLAGSMLLSLVLFAVVALVALLLEMFLLSLLSIGTGGFIQRPTVMFPGQAEQLSISAVVFSGAFLAVIIGVFLPVVLGPQVRAYQAYDAPDPVPVPFQA